MKMTQEIWKDIPDYKGCYQASNLGSIKSLCRIVRSNKFGSRKLNERILIQTKSSDGYRSVELSIKGFRKSFRVHKLIAMCFHDHTPCGMRLVVNHKDLNKLNNRSDNLEIVTQRENANQKHLKSSSKYTGVYWDKHNKKWASEIRYKGKKIYLGRFTDEEKAAEAYQNKLKEIKI